MRAIGVDVGTRSVKVVALDSGLGGTRVEGASEVSLDGMTIQEALDAALGRLAGPPDAACIGLDRSASLFRTIELPFADPAKVARAAPFAAEGVLPVALDKLKVATLPARPAGTPGRFSVPLHAMPHDQIAARLELLGGIGERVVQIDSVAAAEAVVAEGLGPRDGEAAVLVVDVGASKTVLELLDPSGLVLSRSLRTGTQRMAAAVATELGAVAAIQDAAFADAFCTKATAPGPAALKKLVPVLDELAGEIQRTLLGLPPGQQPAALVLAGGGARVRLLPARLAFKLGLPVRRLTLKALPAGDSAPAERFASAYGLALVAAERGRLGLDLNPVARRPPWQDPVVGLTLALAVALAGLLFAGRLWLAARALEAETVELETRAGQTLDGLKLPRGADLAAQLARFGKLEAVFRGTGRSPLKVFDAVSEAMPASESLRLSAFVLDGQDLRIEARADSFLQAEDLEDALKKIPGLAEVVLEQQSGGMAGRGAGGGSQFTLRARIREEAFR